MEIDHLTVPVSDYERSKRFYAEVLKPLGFRTLLDWYDERRAYLGVPPQSSSLWLVESGVTGTIDIALAAPSAEAVDEFHAAATAAGEQSSRYYAARVLDPDGNSIEAVHRTISTETRAAA